MLWYVVKYSSLSILFSFSLACTLICAFSFSLFIHVYTFIFVSHIVCVGNSNYTSYYLYTDNHISIFIHWTVTKTCAYEATCCFSSSLHWNVVCAHKSECVCMCVHCISESSSIHSYPFCSVLFTSLPHKSVFSIWRLFKSSLHFAASILSVNTTLFTCFQNLYFK